MTSPLFTPFTLNRLPLPNRWVMSAMQRGMCREGNPSVELAAYYRRRTEGGVPLIIGESAAPGDIHGCCVRRSRLVS